MAWAIKQRVSEKPFNLLAKEDVPSRDSAKICKVKYLPEGINYSIENFGEFYQKRKILMMEAPKDALGMK